MGEERCPECRAALVHGETCQEHFHQMLYWENEYPGYGAVHHLAVLCYHLQHPSLYSQAGLESGLGLLVEFLDAGRSPAEVRRSHRDTVSSSQRTWKISAAPGSAGRYPVPVAWQMTAADVVRAGPQVYVESVQAWARSMRASLGEAGLLPPPVTRS